MPTESTSRSFQSPTQHPGEQWQYSVIRAPKMGYQRQSSATIVRSLPDTSSGSSTILTPSITFCHHRTTPNQMVRPNALSTPIKRGLLKLKGEGVMDKILATFLLANRTTPNASLPQQCCAAVLLFGCKLLTTVDLLATNQPTGHGTKMEIRFNRQKEKSNATSMV